MVGTRLVRLAVPLLLAGMGITTSAAAAVKQAVWTGTIASGFDTAGIFGLPDTDLSGLSYRAVVRFDPSTGIRITTADYDIAYGGSVYGAPTPMRSAAITINGVTKTIQIGFQDDLGAHPAVGSGMQIRSDYDVGGETRTDFLRLDAVIPGWSSLDDDLTTTNVSGFIESVVRINAPIYSPYLPNDAWADLGSLKGVTITTVPEPATWALLVAGFALSGLQLRRRAARHPAV